MHAIALDTAHYFAAETNAANTHTAWQRDRRQAILEAHWINEKYRLRVKTLENFS